MSTPEEHQEQRSSFLVSLTAKGTAQIAAKRYVGDSDEDFAHARQNALDEFMEAHGWLKARGLIA